MNDETEDRCPDVVAALIAELPGHNPAFERAHLDHMWGWHGRMITAETSNPTEFVAGMLAMKLKYLHLNVGDPLMTREEIVSMVREGVAQASALLAIAAVAPAVRKFQDAGYAA